MFDGPDVAQRWSKWRKAFETYYIAAEVSSKSPEVQVAILLHSAGTEAQEIHSQFVFAAEEDKKEVKKVLDHFDTYCKPRKNTVYERYRFRCRDQVEDEAVDKWVKELKTIASNCEFADEENMIRDQLVFGYRDQKVKERMLRESTLTLSKALEICRAAESTKSQMKSMCSEVSQRDVNTVRGNDNEGFSNNNTQGRCFNCDEMGHFSRDCPLGDSFPRGRRRGRGGHRGSRGGGRGARRGRSRGSHRGTSQQGRFRNNDQYLYQVEEGDSEFTDLSTLSLSTVSLAVDVM